MISARSKFTYQKGLSLIELMIALLLGALLLSGVFRIFDTNQQTSRMATAFSRVPESGRISMEMIARDIRLADYWGCTIQADAIVSHIDSSDAGDYIQLLDPTARIDSTDPASGRAIYGLNNVGASTTVGSIPVRENTDIVTLKGAKRVNNARVVSPYLTQASTIIHITSGVTLPDSELYLISDCNGAELFTNTSSTAGEVDYGEATITGAPDNTATAISENYVAHAQLLQPWSKTYFIGQPTVGVWSLYWQENGGTPVELVRDVEDMQIEYGEDTTGHGSVDDVFDTAAAVTDWDAVISVRVQISTSSASSADGDVMTRNYSVTGNIRNRSL